MSVDAMFFRAPESPRVRLDSRPQLASWDRAGTPSQQRLASYLSDLKRIAAPLLAQTTGPLALGIDVGLPQSIDLHAEHDLDNYLFPLMLALDRPDRRVISVRGRKLHADDSYISVAPAKVAIDRPENWRIATEIVTTASSARRAFKDQIREKLIDVAELPAGGVKLEISYVVGPRRYWPNLWKSTIDALSPILGSTYPNRRWHPRDDRITKLALHSVVDPAIGHAIRIALRATVVTT